MLYCEIFRKNVKLYYIDRYAIHITYYANYDKFYDDTFKLFLRRLIGILNDILFLKNLILKEVYKRIKKRKINLIFSI